MIPGQSLRFLLGDLHEMILKADAEATQLAEHEAQEKQILDSYSIYPMIPIERIMYAKNQFITCKKKRNGEL